MIHPKEINKLAYEHKISDRQIEKDYILSWLLSGIANHHLLQDALIFKGGTVLKKCYFKDYRYSEDLDFTLIDTTLSHENAKLFLQEIFDWIKEEANISIQHKADDVHPRSGSSLFYADYVGPLGGNMGSRDVKFDITRGEILEFPFIEKTIFKGYTDIEDEAFLLKCYALPEVLIEKMVALMGRTEPRDLYDFWYLTNYEGMKPRDYQAEFENKAKNKQQNPDEFVAKVLKKEAIFKRDWESKLKNQIHQLPKFDDVLRETKRYLK